MKFTDIMCRSSSKEADILKKALKKSMFSKVADPGLQLVTSFSTKITFFTEIFSKIVPHAELNS